MDEWDDADGAEGAEIDTHTLRGQLLVATPALTDPNFDRTVILLIDHGPEGALGLVLNRPSEAALEDFLPQWNSRAAPPAAMYLGGPVQPNAVICLARTDDDTGGDPGANDIIGTTAVPGIGLVDLDGDRDRVHPDLRLRCFAGYSGWTAGQLEAEIDEGSWFVVAPDPEDPFVSHPSRLWHQVLARQPSKLARYALYPVDPTVN